MSTHIHVSGHTRADKYRELVPQLTALLETETDMIAGMANIAAALKETFSFFWVGFYIVKGNELVLGPFQGPVACTRIAKGKGVCGTAWENGEVVIVPDVDKFPGHIACSALSKSEIVVPLKDATGRVFAVLDVDSEKIDDFTETDGKHLQAIASLIRNAN
jgi:L-methionine (R)-S-oxide reductase